MEQQIENNGNWDKNTRRVKEITQEILQFGIDRYWFGDNEGKGTKKANRFLILRNIVQKKLQNEGIMINQRHFGKGFGKLWHEYGLKHEFHGKRKYEKDYEKLLFERQRTEEILREKVN